MIFARRCGSFRAHPFAIAAGVCLVLLIVASCIVFKQRRPELFAKALGAAEEKLRTAMVDAGRKEIDLATEGKDIAKRLAEANVVAVATDGLGGVAAVGTGGLRVVQPACDLGCSTWARADSTEREVFFTATQPGPSKPCVTDTT